ncbi:MAG TPA: glycosyltransferase family 2 protein, partial [Chloroflexota bacterium]|nr:glycosyltransferase family 2 protein [Chloroflexota bacterium]
FNIAQVPVNHYHRACGHSQFFNFSRVFRVGVDLINLWRELVLEKGLSNAPTETPAIARKDR